MRKTVAAEYLRYLNECDARKLLLIDLNEMYRLKEEMKVIKVPGKNAGGGGGRSQIELVAYAECEGGAHASKTLSRARAFLFQAVGDSRGTAFWLPLAVEDNARQCRLLLDLNQPCKK